MLKKLALAVVALVALVVVVGLARGRHWRVEKAAVINAKPETLHAFVDDFERGWTRWSVWHAMDPKGVWSYAGTPGTVGHTMSWQGPEVGTGKLTLTKIEPLEVAYDGAIESNDVNDKGTLTFTPDPTPGSTATKVVWIDEGDAPPVVGGLFKGMLEAMLGDQFQKNLDALKVVAEKKQVDDDTAAAQAKAAGDAAAAAAPAPDGGAPPAPATP